MAEQLECDRSTIHRYLKDIEVRHELIRVSHGVYRLDSSKYVSNVQLSTLEALSLYLALRRFIRQTTRAPQFMITALRKVAIALRHPLLITQLSQSTTQLGTERPAPPEYANIWQVLLQAWQESIVVRIGYTKLGATTVDIHEIEPYLFEPAILSRGEFGIRAKR